MDCLKKSIIILSLSFLLINCQDKPQTEVKIEVKVDPLDVFCDSISALFSMNSLRNEDFISIDDTLYYKNTKALISRKFKDEKVKEMRLTILSEDSISQIRIKESLLNNYFGEDHHCLQSFCSLYGKSVEKREYELLFMDESAIRGIPYLAFRILEKDGIAE